MAKTETSPWKIAVGVCLGVVGATVFMRACDAGMEQARVDEVSRQFHALERRTQPRHDEAQNQQAEQQARNAANTARLRALISAQQSEAASSAAAAASRTVAWQRNYQRPKECENPPTDQAFIECSNRAIQAREQFDKTYQP